GMNEHLAKPINPQHLLKVLLQCMDEADLQPEIAPEPEPCLLPLLPGLDLEKALQRFGSLSLLKRMLPRLRDHYWDAAPRLQQLVQEGALFEAERLAHSLKGVAGTLEALTIYHLAQKLEEQLHGGHTEIAELLNQLDLALQEVAVSIDSWLGVKEAVAVVVEEPAETVLSGKPLHELSGLLQQKNLRARKCFHALQKSLMQLNSAKTLQMAEAMERLDFKTAADLLQSFNK
ncbi:MAG: Hpt domain-containing protein, partial [Iodobacter sp.]